MYKKDKALRKGKREGGAAGSNAPNDSHPHPTTMFHFTFRFLCVYVQYCLL